jgi:Concanavalin A-like lectin/glucanases superfamily/Immunoglobulin I-set domain/Immunoglobulin domain
VIDEASIYNRALTASEVAAIFIADGSGKCPVSTNQPPQIITQPANQIAVAGATASFTVAATGSAPLNYQWQLNGQNLTNSSHFVGATSSTLTIVGVTAADVGSYRVIVSNAAGSTTSPAASLTLVFNLCTPVPPGLIAWYKAEGNPSDSADSQNASLANGAGFSPGKVGLGFSLNGLSEFVQLPPNLFPYPTSGTTGHAPFSFETWFSTLSGGVILGQQEGDQIGYPFATPNAFVPAVYVGHDGKLYVMMFWDVFGQIISSGTVNDGAFHHVAVTYDGTTETAYLDGVIIGSRLMTQVGYASSYYYQLGTGYTYGWPSGNTGWFSFSGVIDEASVYNRALNASEVVAIFSAGSSGKCPVTTGGQAPQITTQPVSQTVAAGSTVSFSVTATGTAPLTFQWQFNGQNLANSTHYLGATSNMLTIVGVSAADVGSYRVVVSNASGSANSITVALALQQQGCAPAPPGLIAWYKAEGNTLDSADSHAATIIGGVGFQAGKVGQGFYMPGGAACVQLPPNLFPYPTAGSGNAAFSFETWFLTPKTGGVILGQQEGDASGLPFGAPKTFVPAVYVGNDGRLRVQMFWDGFGQIVSAGLVNDNTFHHVAVCYDGLTEIVYLDGIVIGSQSMTQLAYAAGYNYQLGTGYTSGWPAANQGWFSFVGFIDEASVYNRALSASEVVAIVNAGSSGKCPPSTTTPPVILSQPSDLIVAPGGNATFVVATGGGVPQNFQWQFNGTNIVSSTHYLGVNSNSLTVVGVTAADAGAYRLLVSNSAGSIFAGPAFLSVSICVPPPPGLIAWYRAETNALDSADSHNGTFMNDAWVVAGEVGYGFDLLGNGGYIALPPNLFPYPTSGSGNTPFSFETWFSTGVGGVILGQQDTTPFNKPNAYVPAVYVGTDGYLYVSMFWDMFVRIISPVRVNDGIFHHVAVTYDGSTEVVYLDGVAIGSTAFTQVAYASTYYYQLGTGFTAGLWPAANPTGWFSFAGVIDEASIYNRALTAAEVSSIVAAGKSGKCPPPGS